MLHHQTFKACVMGVVALFSGCYTPPQVISSTIDAPNYLVQFNADDFHIGETVSVIMDYDPNNKNMQQLLLNKAIAEYRCDTLLMPRYEVILDNNRRIIKVTGRVATLKSR